MICSKCNHKLPDDSAFCQYCGNRLEKVVVPSDRKVVAEPKKVETHAAASATSVVEGEPGGGMPPEEAMHTMFRTKNQNAVNAMKVNGQTEPDYESDEDFGLVPEKPIYTLAQMSVDGEREYLEKLYTVHGQKIKYSRCGSTSVDGINGMIDIYNTYLPSGQPYRTVYINMYGAKKTARHLLVLSW